VEPTSPDYEPEGDLLKRAPDGGFRDPSFVRTPTRASLSDITGYSGTADGLPVVCRHGLISHTCRFAEGRGERACTRQKSCTALAARPFHLKLGLLFVAEGRVSEQRIDRYALPTCYMVPESLVRASKVDFAI